MNEVERLAAVARMEAVLARLLDHPLSRDELAALEAKVERAEAELEELGAVAKAERADVEALERWVTATMLALAGVLETLREKERREYDAAVAAVLRQGEQARGLREELEALPPMPPVPPRQVCQTLAALDPRDLDRFPTELHALRTRAVQSEGKLQVLDQLRERPDSPVMRDALLEQVRPLLLEAGAVAILAALDEAIQLRAPVGSLLRGARTHLVPGVEAEQHAVTQQLFDQLRARRA